VVAVTVATAGVAVAVVAVVAAGVAVGVPVVVDAVAGVAVATVADAAAAVVVAAEAAGRGTAAFAGGAGSEISAGRPRCGGVAPPPRSWASIFIVSSIPSDMAKRTAAPWFDAHARAAASGSSALRIGVL